MPTRTRRSVAPTSASESAAESDDPLFTSHQIIDPSGAVVGTVPDLTDDDLLRLHRAMVLTRVFDVRMLTMQRQGQMGTFAPGYGQEATQIGQVFPLGDIDWFAPSYRSFGAQLWRGWELERLMLLWDGYHDGFPPPPNVRDLPFSIVIGSHVLPAVGIGMGMRYRGEEGVIVTNFGDGALSQGAVAEAFNFATVYDAPVVFVVENNGYAISTPTTKQCGIESLAARGSGFGMPAQRVDGNDILAMTDAMTTAVDRARRGDGPTLIEAVTYRIGVHTTADDPTVYRQDAEVEEWKGKCPITRFEAFLAARGTLDADGAREVVESCERDVLAARDQFRAMAEKKPQEIFDYMFETLTPELREQYADYVARLQRKGITVPPRGGDA